MSRSVHFIQHHVLQAGTEAKRQGIGKKGSSIPLKKGMVLSNEPGYYEKEKFGIRIENLIYVKKAKKKTYFENLINGKTPEVIVRKAVERMMSSNALSKKQLSNLKIFAGDKHDHEAQKPELIDFGKLNRKNKVV